MKAPGAQMIASVTFIAILMTILIQAPTTEWLGRRLGLLEQRGRVIGLAFHRPSPGPCRAAQRLRRPAEGADEGAAHPLRIAKAGGLRHPFDRLA